MARLKLAPKETKKNQTFYLSEKAIQIVSSRSNELGVSQSAYIQALIEQDK